MGLFFFGVDALRLKTYDFRLWSIRSLFHLISYILYLSIIVLYLLTSHVSILRLTSYVSRLTSHVSILRLTSYVLRLTSHVSRLTSYVSRLIHIVSDPFHRLHLVDLAQLLNEVVQCSDTLDVEHQRAGKYVVLSFNV